MKLSGSSLGRAVACPPSALLPHVDVILEAGTRGTVIHEYLASVPVLGREAALENVPEDYQSAAQAVRVDVLPVKDPGAWSAELAFAYDPATDTARELGRGLSRRYAGHIRAGEIPGTADVVGLTEDAVVVLDWKTGRLARKERAADSYQLRFYALAAARAFKRSKAIVALVHIDEDGEPWWDMAELDALDLDATAAEIRMLLARLDDEASAMALGETPRLVEGSHCKYCPALPHCPAKAKLAVALGTGMVDLPTITAENAPHVLEALELAESLLKHIRESVKEYARLQPIALANGEVFGPVESRTETIDPVKGAAVLAARFGAEVGQDAVEQTPKLTKTRLGIVLREWMKANPGHRIKALETEALGLLRAGGAVSVAVSEQVKRHRPKAALPEGRVELAPLVAEVPA